MRQIIFSRTTSLFHLNVELTFEIGEPLKIMDAIKRIYIYLWVPPYTGTWMPTPIKHLGKVTGDNVVIPFTKFHPFNSGVRPTLNSASGKHLHFWHDFLTNDHFNDLLRVMVTKLDYLWEDRRNKVRFVRVGKYSSDEGRVVPKPIEFLT